MTNNIKSIKQLSIFLTMIVLIPLGRCGPGLNSLMDDGNSSYNDQTSMQILAPESPANVLATDGTYPDRIVITWNSSASAKSYNIYRSDGSSYIQIEEGVTGLVYNDVNILRTRNPYTYYIYKVTAANSAGESDIASSLAIPDQGYADPWSTQPNSPTNLIATDGTGVGTITLSWDGMENTSYYNVYKSSTSGGTYVLEAGNITGTTYNVNSTEGSAWWFKASAINSFGESSRSLPDVGHAMAVPSALSITNLVASDSSYHYVDYIHVQWTAATSEGTILGYNIYGSDTADGEYAKLNTSLITDLYYNEDVPLEGKVRYYKVSAVNEAGESAPSDYVSGQTWGTQPAAPTGVAASQGAYTDRVLITWSASADTDGYRVFRANTSDGIYTQIGSDPGVVTSYEDTAAAAGYHYFYRVSAYKTYGGQSILGSYVEGWKLGPADQVTGVSATDGTIYRQISITWTQPSGTVASYRIYKSDSYNGTYTLLASDITLQSYTDNSPDLNGEGIYRCYKVSAVNAAGEGAQSVCGEGNTMTVPSAPLISASDGSFNDRVRITWTAPSGPLASYTVYRCDNAGCSGTVETIATGITVLTYDDIISNYRTYYYSVSAVNDAGESAMSTTDVGTTNDVVSPGVPAIISATQGTQAGGVYITWSSVSDAGWYNVYRCDSSTGTYTKINGSNITALNFTSSTTAGVHWFYKVTAQNNVGESDLGSYAEGWAMPVASQATGVVASEGISTTGITVSWNAVSDAVHYHVYRSLTLSGTYTMIADNITLLTYTDSSGIDASQHWYYRVSAVNAAGEGAPSNADSGWTLISAPAGVAATEGTYDDYIRITWNASAGATGYNVYGSTTQSGAYTVLTASPISALTYDDPVLLVHMWYKVTAVNGDGESALSSSAEGWPLDDSGTISTPANITATQGSYTDKVTITWNTASNAVYYNIYRSAAASGTYTMINSSSITSSTYDDSTVSCNTHYFYRVTAVNDHGTESGQSSYSEGYALPAGPNAPSTISSTSGTELYCLTVTWSSVSGATGYNVYVSDSSSGTYTRLNTSTVTSTSYIETGLACGQTRFYRVSSIGGSPCYTEGAQSAYASGKTMALGTVSTPAMNPVGGAYIVDQSVTITCATSGAVIYYTTDGSNPTASSAVYSSPISVSGYGTSMTIKACAVKSGWIDSSIKTETYSISIAVSGSWAPVGSEGFSAGSANFTSLYIYNGTPYVAYSDNANSGKATVMKYSGSSWVTVGSAGFAASYSHFTSLYIDSGTPYVAYGDASVSGRASVMKYNGSSWVTVGSAGFSAGYADYTSLYIYNGTPYVAYRDDGSSQKATVMKYNGSSWVTVGSAGFSAGYPGLPSIYVYSGKPYVSYWDGGNSNKPTVMQYSGSSWAMVGGAACSTVDASGANTSLFVYNGTPYMAFKDNMNSGKATVMKYNGSSWVTVGNAGFSAGDISGYVTISLYVYFGIPFVAYKDNANSGKATVMMCIGSTWMTVGTAAFSSGTADYLSLFVYNGVPYVAFSDGGNSNYATVMKFQ